MIGSYQAYWIWLFDFCTKYRPDFGTTPNAATFDANMNAKIREAIANGTFNPLTVYEDHIWLLQTRLQTGCLLRAAKEPSLLTIPDFVFSASDEGKYIGANEVKLKSSHLGQKQRGMTLSNYTRIDPGNKHAHLPFYETTDPLCTYKLIKRQIFEYMPPDCKGTPANRILRREAPMKLKKVRAVFVFCMIILFSIAL